MNKKKWISLCGLVLVIAAVIFGFYQYNATYVHIGSTRYQRDMTTLDLSGTTLTEPEKLTGMPLLKTLNLENTGLSSTDYDMLCQALPECEISWTPIFQGTAYPADTKILNVTTLSAEDVQMLAYFPQLQTVNAMGCQDYDNLLTLRQALPACDVRYSVTIGDREYLHDTTFVRIPDANMAQVEQLLKYLPDLNTVLLTGALPAAESIEALSAAYPEIAISWQGEYNGIALDSAATELDLTDIPLESTDAVTALLPYLPKAEKIILCNTGLPTDAMMGLREGFENINFVWDITIGATTVRTDAVEIDISGNQITPEDIEALLPYFTDLEKVVMCDCGIENEAMDALNRRHENIKFVWSVDLGYHVTVRTDITSFIPYKFGYQFYQWELENLRYCTDLVALDLGHQKLYTCEFVRYMPNLKYLVLADTSLRSLEPLTGLENLVFLEIFLTYVTDYTPLLTLTNLKDLNLAWTYGDYMVIAQMPWLERCWWGGTLHSYDSRVYLKEHCPNTQFEFDDGESTGSGWRTSKYYYEMRDALGMFYMN